MPYEQGLSDWRVYTAEESVGEQQELSLSEAQDLIQTIVASQWWSDTFPHVAPIGIEEGGQEHHTPAGGTLIGSYAKPVGWPAPTKWLISIHPGMCNSRVVLHELAHCAAPRNWGNPKLIRSGKIDGGEYRFHGAEFAATCALITEHVLPVEHGELVSAFDHFEVPVATLSDLKVALDAQPDLDDALTEFHAKLRQLSAEHETERAAEGRPAGRVPEAWWGSWLWLQRSHPYQGGRKVSLRSVAAAVRHIVPCSPSQISALESAKVRPTDPRELRRAMGAAIFLGLDPIYMRYVVGLTRWDCGDEISIDDARKINENWADLVEHINTLNVQRPPRWFVEGVR